MLWLSIVWRCPVCNHLEHLLYTDAQPGTFGPTCTHQGTRFTRGECAMEPIFIERVHESSTHSWASPPCLGECLFKGDKVRCKLQRDHVAQCEADLPDGTGLAWD